MDEPRGFLLELFRCAVAAAQPREAMATRLPDPPVGRTVVLGAGKAAASMAAALEDRWSGGLSGLVVVPYGHTVPTRRIEVVEAAHPVPDANGLEAAGRIIALAEEAGPDDLVICLISGGASALLTLPAAGVTLADKRSINKQLLRAGVPIHDMNIVHKCLSGLKGGRLGAAIAPAPALTLLISDVPGDEPGVIGSGPTVADASATADAAAAISDRYGIDLPPGVAAAMLGNPPVADLPPNQQVRLVAAPHLSLQAAAEHARALGVKSVVLGDALAGEAGQVARTMAQTVREARARRDFTPAGCVLLSGGETTVTLGDSRGRGGRNGEFLLALALALAGEEVYALACDTDGIDGSEDNAGAVIDPTTIQRAIDSGLDPERSLLHHDSYGIFSALGDLVVTGPTMTNVNDFRAIYVPG